MLAATGFQLSPVSFFGFQIFLMALVLWFTRKLLKFSWIKSLWISAGFTSVASLLLLLYGAGDSLDLITIILSFLPILIVAAGTIIRAVIKYFGNMDDGGGVNSAERQRTLEMVEQGKITSEEGAELLEALGRSNAMLGQDKFSRLDMLILAGVAIIVFGFFLPWLQINILSMVPNLQSQYTGGANVHEYIRTSLKGRYFVHQSGDQAGAIGWTILIIGVLAAIPVFITPKNFLYKISMLQIFLLSLDIALVISVMIRAGENIMIGLLICLVGIVLALFACFKKFKKLAA